jgi:7,8-dihydro-6-hydroxymethylpterin dimethyltransferase
VTVYHATESFCCDCQASHPADLRAHAGAMYFDVHCPAGAKSMRISSDEAVFRALRAKSALPDPPLPSVRGFSWSNFIEITKECNCTCAVCFSASHPGAGGELSLEQVVDVARRLRAEGLCAVTLSGGEPTLHPRLVDIVRAVRGLGMDVTMASNGLRLARDPGLARQLRRAGVNWIHLQMDTLTGEICRTLRGEDFVELKKQAAANLRAAGLRFGLTATVIRDNLPEAGDVLRFAAGHLPHLGAVGFLSAAPAGRFALPEQSTVNREDIIASLVGSGAVAGLRAEHFWPFPRFSPFALDVHPDCAALLYLAATPAGLFPLDEFVRIDRLYRLMRRSRARFNRFWGFLLLSVFFLLSIRPRRVLAVARMAWGMLSRRGRHAMMAVSVEHFLGRDYQDRDRLDRCTTCNVRPDGSRVSTCVFNHPDARRSPATREAGPP